MKDPQAMKMRAIRKVSGPNLGPSQIRDILKIGNVHKLVPPLIFIVLNKARDLLPIKIHFDGKITCSN